MKPLLKILSGLSLVVILAAPLASLAGWIGAPLLSPLLLAATIVWFASAPFWMLGRGN